MSGLIQLLICIFAVCLLLYWIAISLIDWSADWIAPLSEADCVYFVIFRVILILGFF